MKKKFLRILIVCVFAFSVFMCQNVSAKTTVCGVDAIKKVVLKKGEKIKIKLYEDNNVHWYSKSKKLKVTKTGKVTAKKIRKANIYGKKSDGSKIKVKVIVKKKTNKASTKNVTVTVEKGTNNDIEITLKNKSDEWINAIWEGNYIKQNILGDVQICPKKNIAETASMYPLIYLAPGATKKIKNYSLSNYDLTAGSQYYIELGINPGYQQMMSQRTFGAKGYFIY